LKNKIINLFCQPGKSTRTFVTVKQFLTNKYPTNPPQSDSNMQKLKLQFEVRYTPILNFHEINRRILSPFLKLAEASINSDENGEYIVLIFKEERFFIDCRWDRIIFVNELERDDLTKEDGPLQQFYNILDRYKKSDSFGKITEMILASWSLNESEESFVDTVKGFKMRYLSSNIPMEFYNPTDIAITLEVNEKIRVHKITFGPFNGMKDLERFKIFSTSRSNLIEYSKKSGIIFELVDIHKTIDVSLEAFSKMLKKHNSKLNSFK